MTKHQAIAAVKKAKVVMASVRFHADHVVYMRCIKAEVVYLLEQGPDTVTEYLVRQDEDMVYIN